MIGENILRKIKDKAPLKIAIIGGGAGAREFVLHYAALGGNEVPTAITIFEPRPMIGRGIAWSEDDTNVIANMRVETLGPNYPEFDLIKRLLTQIGHPEADSEYPSRKAVGAALDRRWQDKLGDLPPDWDPIRHVCDEVIDLIWDGGLRKATVTPRKGTPIGDFDLVVLALGNLRMAPPSDFPPGAAAHGWDLEAIAQIDPKADVLIKGAGLTAIDVTIRLLEQGHIVGRRSIVWHSKKGSLPLVRPRQLPALSSALFTYPALSNLIEDYRRRGVDLTLERLKNLFAREMINQQTAQAGKYAENTDLAGLLRLYELFEDPSRGREQLEEGIQNARAPSLWFSVAKLLDEYTIPLIWNAMPNSEKVCFLQRWRRDFDRFWAPIPVVNGQRIKQWLEDGTIQLLRTQIDYRFRSDTGKIAWDERLDDPLGEVSREQLRRRYDAGFDILVDASGIPGDLEKLDSDLVRNLMRRGILTHFMLRGEDDRMIRLGAQVDWYSGAVLCGDGSPHGWLFSLTGSLTTGAHRFTNSYLAVTASADRTATALFRDLDN